VASPARSGLAANRIGSRDHSEDVIPHGITDCTVGYRHGLCVVIHRHIEVLPHPGRRLRVRDLCEPGRGEAAEVMKPEWWLDAVETGCSEAGCQARRCQLE
jgi:hypothetical protein